MPGRAGQELRSSLVLRGGAEGRAEAHLQGSPEGWEEPDNPRSLQPGWRVVHGPQLRKREDGREGRISGWAKAAQAMKKEARGLRPEAGGDDPKYPSEAFYALDDPLEAAVLVLIEILRELEEIREHD